MKCLSMVVSVNGPVRHAFFFYHCVIQNPCRDFFFNLIKFEYFSDIRGLVGIA